MLHNNAKFWGSLCWMSFMLSVPNKPIMLNVFMMSVLMLSAIMLIVTMLRFVKRSDIMLSVFMVNVFMLWWLSLCRVSLLWVSLCWVSLWWKSLLINQTLAYYHKTLDILQPWLNKLPCHNILVLAEYCTGSGLAVLRFCSSLTSTRNWTVRGI